MDITDFDVSKWVEKEDMQEHMAMLAANATEFLNSVGKEALEVYRIESFKPTLQPKESYGKFYQGDSYVVVKQNDEDYMIHYWHGKDCTTDEMGSSAAFSVQLSATLPKSSSHSLELQMHETDIFCSYFKNGLEYLPGGVDSGFNHVEEKVFETRLLQVKCKTSARIFQVALEANSINEGDIFILETNDKIYLWVGKDANVAERGKAFSYAESMRRYERHCNSQIVHPREEPELDNEFWGILGGRPATINPAVPDDVPTEDEQLHYSLWEIKQDGTGKVNCTEIKQRPLKRAMLDTTNVYILETHKQVNIWIGAEADLEEKKNSLFIGKGFVEAHSKPKGTRVFRIVENAEDQLFKSYFDGFNEPAVVSVMEKDKHAEKIAAVAAKKQEVVANLLTKLGNYTVNVYLCKDGECVKIPEAEYGHFF